MNLYRIEGLMWLVPSAGHRTSTFSMQLLPRLEGVPVGPWR